MLTVNSLVVGLYTAAEAVVAKTFALATDICSNSPIISSWHPQAQLCAGKPLFAVDMPLPSDRRALIRFSRRRTQASAVL